MCNGLHPLYFTLLYICPQTKVKRFPVCAVMVEAGYETIPFFRTVILLFLSSVNIIFSFRPYLFVYYGLYPLYFTSVYIWYGTKVKWFPYNTANSENRF